MGEGQLCTAVLGAGENESVWAADERLADIAPGRVGMIAKADDRTRLWERVRQTRHAGSGADGTVVG